MDPDAAVEVMRDGSANVSERFYAAHGLSVWLERGGFVPVGEDAGALRREAFELSASLERLV